MFLARDDHIKLNMNKENCFNEDCLFEMHVLKFNLLCSLPIYMLLWNLVTLETIHCLSCQKLHKSLLK
jgi:hypothetical protein